MSFDRDDLLTEENLTFTPLSGSFDVEAIMAFVSGLGYAYRDEQVPNAFALFTAAEYRDECRDMRRQDPTSSFPYVPAVTVKPQEVVFYPVASQEDLRGLSIQFLKWMLENCQCRIENDCGADVTEPRPSKDAESEQG